MSQPATTLEKRQTFGHDAIASPDYLLRQGVLKLLAIKDSDIRILVLEQCRTAVDKGLHAGGAFSAVIPLVSVYYGGFLVPDVADPTRRWLRSMPNSVFSAATSWSIRGPTAASSTAIPGLCCREFIWRLGRWGRD